MDDQPNFEKNQSCPSVISIAVINARIKSNLEEGKVYLVYTLHSQAIIERSQGRNSSRAGTGEQKPGSRNLGAGTKAVIMEEHCLLDCSPRLSHRTQDHLFWAGTVHSRLGPPK